MEDTDFQQLTDDNGGYRFSTTDRRQWRIQIYKHIADDNGDNRFTNSRQTTMEITDLQTYCRRQRTMEIYNKHSDWETKALMPSEWKIMGK
ncbi:hypothetical protein BgiBS90_030829 [Biomphalaria glabrata]|nr:hypothetical protein BgiBS90_030829 [Biomphalaria glabrata]